MAVAGGENTARQGRFAPDLDLTAAGGATQLLYAVAKDGRAGAPRADVAAAGQERVRTFDPEVLLVEVVGFALLHAVPAVGLQPVLGKEGEPIVGVENVDVGRGETGALIGHAGHMAGPLPSLLDGLDHAADAVPDLVM